MAITQSIVPIAQTAFLAVTAWVLSSLLHRWLGKDPLDNVPGPANTSWLSGTCLQRILETWYNPLSSQAILNSCGMFETAGLFTRASRKSVRVTIYLRCALGQVDTTTIADGSVIKLAGPFGVWPQASKNTFPSTDHIHLQKKSLYVYDPKALHHILVKVSGSICSKPCAVNSRLFCLGFGHAMIVVTNNCIQDLYTFDESPGFTMYVHASFASFCFTNWPVSGADMSLGKGLFATSGDMHRRQRKMLNPVFSIAHMREMGTW